MLSQWQKPLQILIAIFFTLMVGTLIAKVPSFAETALYRHLDLADLIVFLTQLAALLLLYLLAREVKESLPKNGKICSFLRGILPPIAALLILILGEDVLMDILEPFLSITGERLVILLFWLAILASGVWLIWSSYQHGPELIAGIVAWARFFETWGKEITLCPACGAHIDKGVKFCGYCGAPIQSKGDNPPSTISRTSEP